MLKTTTGTLTETCVNLAVTTLTTALGTTEVAEALPISRRLLGAHLLPSDVDGIQMGLKSVLTVAMPDITLVIAVNHDRTNQLVEPLGAHQVLSVLRHPKMADFKVEIRNQLLQSAWSKNKNLKMNTNQLTNLKLPVIGTRI